MKESQIKLKDIFPGNFGFTEQTEGSYYTRYKIQPAYFCEVNQIPFCASNIIKYILRYDDKDGIKDLVKAFDYACKWGEVLQKGACEERELFTEFNEFIEMNNLNADITFVTQAVCVVLHNGVINIADVKKGVLYLVDKHYGADLAYEMSQAQEHILYNVQ